MDETSQATLNRDWSNVELVIPRWEWHGCRIGNRHHMGLYWSSPNHPYALEGLMWWFDEDGNCDNWELML